jgi:hypothetical protein
VHLCFRVFERFIGGIESVAVTLPEKYRYLVERRAWRLCPHSGITEARRKGSMLPLTTEHGRPFFRLSYERPHHLLAPRPFPVGSRNV